MFRKIIRLLKQGRHQLKKLPEIIIYNRHWIPLYIKSSFCIKRHSFDEQIKIVSLFDIKFLHPINSPIEMKKTAKRENDFRRLKKKILAEKIIKIEDYMSSMPSEHPIEVLQHENEKDNYIVIEGNGRIKALQNIFKKKDSILIEVQVSYLSHYYFSQLEDVRTQAFKYH